MKNFFQRLFRWGAQKKEINYFYFGTLLLFLSLLSFSHFLSKDLPFSGIHLFFFFHALIQASIEIGFFVLIAYLLKRPDRHWGFILFICISLIPSFLHFTDFTMVRLIDASISYLFKFLFGGGSDHLVAAFGALNLNGTMIGIIFATILSIPLFSLFFYWISHRLTKRKLLSLSFNQIAGALVSMALFLFLLDVLAHPFLNRRAFSKYQKVLPFGTTFLPPEPHCISLGGLIAPPREEKETLENIPEITLSHLPNIYLFIIETLRRDFVNETTAPNLNQFAKENIQFPTSFANANSTHLSWFSIFHSDFPYQWAKMRDQRRGGSIPLQFLKKLGYQIRVYSSADLHYYGMDKLIFGQKRELAETIEEYTLDRTIQPWKRDALALESFNRDLQISDARKGTVFLFFFDSTHSEYSFPDDFPLKFEPIAKEINYLTVHSKSPELESIKNRYRNSILYVDSLLGEFFETLRKQNLMEDAIIAITGDHGEEFFEEKALFHGTHLNCHQTSVPLFFKFPSKNWIPAVQVATHMDLFPSILHYLTKIEAFESLFDGQSIFIPPHWPYRITVLQNGSDTPCEFSIDQGNKKLHAKFLDPAHIYSEHNLEILDLQTDGASPAEANLTSLVEIYFPGALTPLLQKKE
ncbi:MAG: sulfatase-like hydrolase/transferase [Chlamydiota bacterium]